MVLNELYWLSTCSVVPELITLDDWGLPIVSGEDVPPGLRDDAEEAVRLCPLLALRLDRGQSRDGQRRAAAIWPAGSSASDR